MYFRDSCPPPLEPGLARRSKTAVALAAAASMLLVGCATGTQPNVTAQGPDPFPAGAELSGVLNIMGYNADADEVARTRADLAGKTIAPATVKAVEGELDVQQFLSAVAAGDAPDLIYANRDQLGTFAARKAIMPIDTCITGEGISLDDFRKPALDQVTFGGHIYGIPEFNQVQIIMANRTLLENAGLDTSDVDGSDWSKVTEANKKLAQQKGSKPSVIGFDSKLPEFLPLWAKANGADMISADGKKAQLDDPKVVAALEFGVGIYTDQGGFGSVKAFRDSADFFGKGNQFATGVLGAMPMEQWYVNILNDVSPGAPVAFDTFKTSSGQPLSFGSGSAWAIPAAGKNPQAACRYIKTITETASWMAAAEARATARQKEKKPFTGLFTANQKADEQIKAKYVDSSAALQSPWKEAVQASYEANEASFSLPANPADAEFKQAWLDGVNRVLNSKASPAESMATAQKEAQSALDKAWSTLEKADADGSAG
ncbi:ABC transporter substrate-binding protein [Paeniglutamicibacter sp. Y32M11]|uniref:ABC transporter substrate-binding protein n=1 Tax=Paeniglutamicibacter sp. Y32M11 TaxID=2853258 RepID=UPI001C52A261|nr:ABC transporter substrate-binding protein [Paeniglutamicibacter sp. Y32M11]QXQ08723.1 ABC transporter substrate-binding protein [Paeniglutamicibacter sp. Y32M11]